MNTNGTSKSAKSRHGERGDDERDDDGGAASSLS
jgi:hypothetical protein